MSLTFGQTSAPSNITTYLDSVFATSLANYRKQLIDNIGATNAFLYDLLQNDMYESADGGTYIAEDLMYGLAPADFYDGYDELSTQPTDGITQAIFEWRQMASPVVYNMKEVIQNEHRILDLVKARIQQTELGIQEGWAQAFMWGSAPSGGNIYTPKVSSYNGATGIDPLGKLVSYNNNLVVGNIDSAANSWWQNRWASSAATTYQALILEFLNMYNRTGLGTGGQCTHMLLDQVSYQLFTHAYFTYYKQPAPGVDNYPFVATKFLNAKVIMDDKVPDAFSNSIGTMVGGEVDPTTLAFGSCYYLNSKFFRVRYHPDRNWEMLKDENGKTFAKPINGDSRVGHCAWMGATTLNNRRKHGVLGHIARTLTIT